MTGANKKEREALSRLADVLIEDVLAATDQEVLAEFLEAQGDPAKNADAMRALFETSVQKANKDRLRAAQAGSGGEPEGCCRPQNCQHGERQRAAPARSRILPSWYEAHARRAQRK